MFKKIIQQDYAKIIRIAAGFSLALLLAEILGLKYSASAGLIALLSIQTTKKETVKTALTRFIAMAVTFVLVFVIFNTLGFTVLSFGVFVLIFSGYCVIGKAEIALPMNTVLASHFWIEQRLDFNFYMNELLIFAIGAGFGILLNLFLSSKIKHIRETQAEIEAELKQILIGFSRTIESGDAENLPLTALHQLKETVKSAQSQIRNYADNTFTQDFTYFVKYVDMRRSQIKVLYRIVNYLKKLTLSESLQIHAEVISAYMNEISKHLHECNNAEVLLKQTDGIMEAFRNSELPKTREEFENRAILFQIMSDTEYFLLIKNRFVADLTEHQSYCYWGNSQENTSKINKENLP